MAHESSFNVENCSIYNKKNFYFQNGSLSFKKIRTWDRYLHQFKECWMHLSNLAANSTNRFKFAWQIKARKTISARDLGITATQLTWMPLFHYVNFLYKILSLINAGVINEGRIRFKYRALFRFDLIKFVKVVWAISEMA